LGSILPCKLLSLSNNYTISYRRNSIFFFKWGIKWLEFKRKRYKRAGLWLSVSFPQDRRRVGFYDKHSAGFTIKKSLADIFFMMMPSRTAIINEYFGFLWAIFIIGTMPAIHLGKQHCFLLT